MRRAPVFGVGAGLKTVPAKGQGSSAVLNSMTKTLASQSLCGKIGTWYFPFLSGVNLLWAKHNTQILSSCPFTSVRTFE